MDHYSPGRPIIGEYCEGEKRMTLEGLARLYVSENSGIIIFIAKAQELYGDMYKKHEYEIMEIFQSVLEIVFVRSTQS